MTSQSCSLVVLTRGDRPKELGAALDSARRQGAWCDIVVVANGCEVREVEAGADVTVVPSSTNVGIPEGRNIGALHTRGDIVIFLDDDAEFIGEGAIEVINACFESNESVGVLAMAIRDPEGDIAQRHVPRIGGRRPEVAGEVTSFLGGACAIRRSCFDEVGGLAGEFFYGLEETEFSWAAIDGGWSIRYEPTVGVQHPRTDPSRHQGVVEITARNRVWLARRRLPLLIAWMYPLVWSVVTTVRHRGNLRVMRLYLRGVRNGLVSTPSIRAPISWSTVARLARLGRPPII